MEFYIFYTSWSTAYNLSVHGPILSLNSKKISIAPIKCFRPKDGLKKLLVINQKFIIITNLTDQKKRIIAVMQIM